MVCENMPYIMLFMNLLYITIYNCENEKSNIG